MRIMKINKAKSLFFDLTKYLVRSNKGARINAQRNNMKKEGEVITTNLGEIKKGKRMQ